MMDYVELWDDYSIQFNETLEAGFGGDWNQLDQEEREIAGLWKLLADGYNGGFEQFFCNWGYPGYWYAMCGLKKSETARFWNGSMIRTSRFLRNSRTIRG